jgi:hypothetical protein
MTTPAAAPCPTAPWKCVRLLRLAPSRAGGGRAGGPGGPWVGPLAACTHRRQARARSLAHHGGGVGRGGGGGGGGIDYQGREVWVLSHSGAWRVCVVVGSRPDGAGVRVHFVGFDNAYDEWLPAGSERLRWSVRPRQRLMRGPCRPQPHAQRLIRLSWSD